MRVKLEPETAFIGKKFVYIFLGVNFVETFVHLAEERVGVPYRFSLFGGKEWPPTGGFMSPGPTYAMLYSEPSHSSSLPSSEDLIKDACGIFQSVHIYRFTSRFVRT